MLSSSTGMATSVNSVVKNAVNAPEACTRPLRTCRASRLLLIDDVITTGATMAAASAELKRAGAAAVDGLAIARVW